MGGEDEQYALRLIGVFADVAQLQLRHNHNTSVKSEMNEPFFCALSRRLSEMFIAFITWWPVLLLFIAFYLSIHCKQI
uniref:Uncharacterized protein n=1 Tax=Heterorhabditis bacteriophora TaxID=37862 RepID=A0A1I7XNP8_HETBA